MVNTETTKLDRNATYGKENCILCSTYKCNKEATHELLFVLDKGTPNRRLCKMYSCLECLGYESDAIVYVGRLNYLNY